jgi:hypothetical protein
MSPGNLNGMLAMGVVFSVLLGPLAVAILGRWRRASAAVSQPAVITPGSWMWTLAAIGACYVVLYMTFGYFVAWQNPALRAYYGGTDPGSFLAGMRQNWIDTPWLFPLQFGRGILWALFLLPLIRRIGCGPVETGFAMVAVFCRLVPAAPLPQSVHAGRHPLESPPRNARVQPDLRLRRGLAVDSSDAPTSVTRPVTPCP